MSDNRVVLILGTRATGLKDGLEYRIACCSADAGGEPDYPPTKPVLHRESARQIFGKSQVFTDEGEALKAAAKLFLTEGGVEYGIKPSAWPEVFFPASDADRRRRQKMVEKRRARRSDPPVAAPPAG
jgi:hypothetical protein